MILRFLLLVGGLVCAGEAVAQTRNAALVVGVQRYDELKVKDALGNLVNKDLTTPRSDANAFAARLRGFDFNVRVVADPADTRRSAIEASWDSVLEQAPDKGVVVFYFAGHGIELRGNNYLLARDTVYSSEDAGNVGQLINSSIQFQSLIEKLAKRQQQARDLVGVFIIDACRENPFDFKSADAGKLLIALGPSVPSAMQLFVMYSAGVGQFAMDAGGGNNHSLYADEILRALTDKKLPLSEVAQRVRLEVYQKADKLNHLQTPAYYDQLRSRLAIGGEPAEPVRISADKNLRIASTRSLGVRESLIECTYCPEMVVVPPGTLKMGSEKSEPGHVASEAPRHSVSISRGFAIGKYEVTNREWAAFCEIKKTCKSVPSTMPPAHLKPVTGVSWSEVQDFIAWVNESSETRKYRLPTEAEWEYAARGEKGRDTRYAFGEDEAKICEYANGADRRLGVLPNVNSLCDDGVGRETGVVGRYRPNDFGLHDMHGNVWEWVQDCWHANYTGAPADGSAWITPDCTWRVARGGSWRSGPSGLRAATRNAFPASHGRPTVGFRLARDLE